MLKLVEIKDIGNMWDLVTPFLELTDNRGTSVDQLYGNITQRGWGLWVSEIDNVIVGAATTAFVWYDDRKMLRIETIGGYGLLSKDLMQNLEEMEQWAKNQGCVAMDIFGRKGWEKILNKQGYEFDSILMRKNLN